jgi:ABC-type transporter Mla maintaining outer membrane lipid asymmetry permease subunit MlaE
MNHSMVTADRNTHIKVVVLALVAGIVGVVIGFNAGGDHSGSAIARAESGGPAIKASKVILFTTRDGSEVR